MSDPLRILILEDTPSDVDLVERELRRGGVAFVSRVARRRDEFEEHLHAFRPDVILSDHSLPQFNSIDAMTLWRAYQQAYDVIVPFILVTGSVSEEFAVESLKAGAFDYILKDRLKRLPSSVISSVEKARLEMEQQRNVAENLAQSELMKEAEHLAHFGSWSWDLPTQRIQWSDEAYRVHGFTPGSVEPSLELFMSRVHPDDRPTLEHLLRMTFETRTQQQTEYRILDEGGGERILLSRVLVKADALNQPVQLIGFTMDVTADRQQTRELEARNARLMEIAWVQSHEVRGPLARLMGLVHLMMRDDRDEKTATEALPHILHSANELDDIIRKIVRKTEDEVRQSTKDEVG